MINFVMRFLSLILLVFVSACSFFEAEEEKELPLLLKPASFADLPGWGSDDFAGFREALDKSCTRILKNDPARKFGPLDEAGTYASWQRACRNIRANPNLKVALEQNFTPHLVTAGGEEEGLFTGYYEASLRGSRERVGPYRYPLHARPDDLVMVQLGDFRDDLKGRRIAGRVIGGNLKPYESREEIVTGAWPHNDKVLVWVDDPVDAFFVQIQGSGVVELADANGETSVMRIGYAGQNGHPYYAIGRELIKREYLTKETVSMQSIRTWLEANPDEADEIMNTNRSYVFFRESDKDGAIGGEGVVLTAERSLAIDRSKIPYGMPMWVDIAPPKEGEQGLQRLMMAQDTGGAIRGAVRGDVYWGYGDRAEYLAGHMKSQGRYWVLLPK